MITRRIDSTQMSSLVSRLIIGSSVLATLLAIVPSVVHAENKPGAAAATADAAADGAQIVAEINKSKITRAELTTELDRQLRGQASLIPEDQRRELRKNLLDKMIDRQLLFDASAAFKPSDEETEKFVAQIKSQLGGDEGLSKALEQNQVSMAEFDEGIRKDLAIKNYLEKKVFSDLKISDEELKKEFDKSPERFAEPERVHARHILFKLDQNADEKTVAEVKAKAEKALAEARANPEGFADLAKKYSEGPTRSKGGDLGFFTKNQMVPQFAEAAFSAKPSEITDLVRTQFGFHIIKVEEKKEAGKPNFDTVKEQLRAQMLNAERGKVVAEHVKKLREGAKIITYLK